MRKRTYFIALGITLFSFGANAQHAPNSEKNTKSEKLILKIHPEFQKQLEAVYKANLKLNEAFVASDAKAVNAAVKPVKDALNKVNTKLLQENAHQEWLAYYKELNDNLQKIEKAADIKDHRKHFSAYNEALYKSIKKFGIGGEEAFYQYCPMALNNEGAYWLSNSYEIRNPYFGDKMLKCGAVKETL